MSTAIPRRWSPAARCRASTRSSRRRERRSPTASPPERKDATTSRPRIGSSTNGWPLVPSSPTSSSMSPSSATTGVRSTTRRKASSTQTNHESFREPVRALRPLGLLLLLAGTLSADVIVLKNGTKVSGRVVDKGVHYEVTTDAGLRTFLRDEVEDILTSPKELLGDVDKTFEQAKQQYTDALALQDPTERNAKLKEAIEKVRGVREVLAAARELFPEDKYAD